MIDISRDESFLQRVYQVIRFFGVFITKHLFFHRRIIICLERLVISVENSLIHILHILHYLNPPVVQPACRRGISVPAIFCKE